MKTLSEFDSPIEIRGILDNYKRLPDYVYDNVNEMVQILACDTSGGRLRFATDSEFLDVTYRLGGLSDLPHMPLTGSSGTDCYVNGKYVGIVRPEDNNTYDVSGRITLGNKGVMKQIELNLPPYNTAFDVKLAFDDDAIIEKPRPYKYEKPIVFYGSSITQGGVASRPGNCYTSILARRLDADYINLGFSGSARGEQIIADYIASIDMMAFVMDYDHNAPDVEHLRNTHSNFFNTIRKAHPTLPIILVTKPDFDNNPIEANERRAVIMQTYLDAFNSGDRNVYFCDGKSMFTNRDRDMCTVDRCHPNDLGMVRMADAVEREFDFLCI